MKILGFIGDKIDEVWKNVIKYEEIYLISNYANVRRIKSGKMLTPREHTNGYLRVSLCIDGKARDAYIHRLIMETFIRPMLFWEEVNHLDGNKRNNKLSNLKICSQSENSIHAYNTGLIINNTGENSHLAKLRFSDMIKIRERYKYERISQYQLAREEGISQQQISRIVNHVNWKQN